MSESMAMAPCRSEYTRSAASSAVSPERERSACAMSPNEQTVCLAISSSSGIKARALAPGRGIGRGRRVSTRIGGRSSAYRSKPSVVSSCGGGGNRTPVARLAKPPLYR